MSPKAKVRLDILGSIALAYVAGFGAATWASRGYVERHFKECYVKGTQDMEQAIFGALDRVTGP